jgi:hypothetical protein
MEKRSSLLILTNSYDLSTNRIIREIGTDRVFRFNFDIWHEYRVEIGPGDFEIANPTGASITRHQISKAYWRKPISRFYLQGHVERHRGSSIKGFLGRFLRRDEYPPRMTPQERYLEAEMDYVVREISSLLWRDRKLVLVEPASHSRLGKLMQMEIALGFFPVPEYRFHFNPRGAAAPVRQRVAKSLSSERLGPNSFLWTTAVDESQLDARLPWFVQDVVDAERDVTVVHIRGRNLAFSLDRDVFIGKSVDWREEGELTTHRWQPHSIPEALDHKITAYMRAIGLDFGRLDFLLKKETYWFLEVNSNGEWGWLDPNGSRGVLEALVAELHPDTPVHPVPVRWASAPEGATRVA